MSGSLQQLARAAGLLTEWTDYQNHKHVVPAETLRGILERLELPAATESDCAASLAQLQHEEAELPPLLVARVGERLSLPPALHASAGRSYRIELESGARLDGRLDADAALPAITEAGYHRLEVGAQSLILAVAPPRCFGIADIAGARRLWGLSVQLYSLPRAGDGGIGDFTGLAQLVRAAAKQGADALAISPVHALFAADPQRYGPYSPSSRLFLNPLYADAAAVFGADEVSVGLADGRLAAGFTEREHAELIDWPAAGRGKMALLRQLYARLPQQPQAVHEAFAQFLARGGAALREHAAFEALHAHFLSRDPAARGWQDWPAALHDPAGRAVAEFARERADELRFHQFLQWLADTSLASAQRAAKEAGMTIGVIADLAIGTDAGGSHAWSCRRDLLNGLSIGAPPDLLNAQGQNWGLTTHSPRALRRNGYRPFIDLLRATLRHAGGLRIDHVFGLQRLWLVPHGADATAGAYLRYPLAALYGLLALESWRHRAIVIGEDLGTAPPGFREQMAAAGLLGTRVLGFERDHDLFIEPARWPAETVAMSSTHDVATLAGWWRARDLDWRARLQLFAKDSTEAAQRAARTRDRQALWDAFAHAGVANGALPAESEASAVIPPAAAYLARTPARLALVAVEDLLGLEEQVNVPGTSEGHPNWRRRLPMRADELLDAPQAAAVVKVMRRDRPRE